MVENIRVFSVTFCDRYSNLLHLAEGRLETVTASRKTTNQPSADAPLSCLGDEIREQVECGALGPAQSASEKLLGEKVNEQIESVILDAAHNACKPGSGEEKSMAGGSREQDCGVLEAKVVFFGIIG